jgi:hypothetical protein
MSVKNKIKDRDHTGKICARYSGPPRKWKTRCPKSWRAIAITRPKRRQTKSVCHALKFGLDSEGIAFPLGNKKPHNYYD